MDLFIPLYAQLHFTTREKILYTQLFQKPKKQSHILFV